MIKAVILIGLVFVCNTVMAAELSGLPVLPQDEAATGKDWLIHDIEQEASVYRSEDGAELILSNGLVRRTFRLAPNATTVAFDNLMTGESVIRGVKPEAVIELDGVRHDVGGLTGQPNYAFLRPEWVDQLENNPDAMQFVGFEIAEPEERMAWKRLRHHAPNATWPPKGVYLRMDYRMPLKHEGDTVADSGVGRKTLLEDDFASLSKDWRVHHSSAHERSSFENEGKIGEIYTPANTSVFVERDLTAEARLVETTIDAGTDRSASWGPGVALIWAKQVVKFNIRPGGGGAPGASFGLWDGHSENANAGGQAPIDLDGPWTLRMRLEPGVVLCEARPEKGPWRAIEKVEVPQEWGSPKAVRIGKMDIQGGPRDHGDVGGLVRLRVLRFAAYGAQEATAPETIAREEAEPEPLLPVRVSVHYELYDGAPVLSKWITVHNDGDNPIRLDQFTCEVLAAVERGAYVETRGLDFMTPNLHVETDMAFSGMSVLNTSRHSVHWVPDPDYHTQVNYAKQTPCQLEVRPTNGPHTIIEPGGSVESFHAYVLVRDSYDRERNGLAQRHLYRLIAPWVTENPLMMHVRFADWETVKAAIDQCAEVGFEMVILTFGSGFNIEDDSTEYLAEMKRYADYAKSKGVEIGGYSLLASRRISPKHDVVMPEGQRPTFGNSPCLGSEWGLDYFKKLYAFYERTGFMLLEHDGSYPGDRCMSTKHPGHDGHEDSQWKQWRMIADYYRWCRENGIYLNVPDYYYLAGSNKCGMGYREVNWSLPRAQQVIHTRQNIFDGTWEKTPSMGWMFVPLTEYHGGGAAATIEPLDEHLDHYERMLYSNLAMGVQACYRGPRLYDTDRTKAMVTEWVAWFKKYRAILESDVIHGRRADGRDIDWMLHVNPGLEHKGMLVVFNPLKEPVKRTLRVPLYYTGLEHEARIREQEGESRVLPLARDYSVTLDVALEAEAFTWFVVE